MRLGDRNDGAAGTRREERSEVEVRRDEIILVHQVVPARHRFRHGARLRAQPVVHDRAQAQRRAHGQQRHRVAGAVQRFVGDHAAQRVRDHQACLRAHLVEHLPLGVLPQLVVGEVSSDLGQRGDDELLRQPESERREPAQTHQRVQSRPQPRLRSLRHRVRRRWGAQAAGRRSIALVTGVFHGRGEPCGRELLHQIPLRVVEFGTRALRALDQEPIAVEGHAGGQVAGSAVAPQAVSQFRCAVVADASREPRQPARLQRVGRFLFLRDAVYEDDRRQCPTPFVPRCREQCPSSGARSAAGIIVRIGCAPGSLCPVAQSN
ncbi:hypothetical protein [Nocardia sp. NPDC019255]|uniref:hypothetical protein n=1 Tax=Nocardia sp. NPDC019255 TaxID=3154591 RepID=UPI0033CF4AC1